MAKAEALYKRHIEKFKELTGVDQDFIRGDYLAILYSACIIAEAIRNEMEDETK